MAAEFYRPPEPAPEGEPAAPATHSGPGPAPTPPREILGRGVWNGRAVEIASEDPDVEAALLRVFRPTSLTVEDPATRARGTKGASVIQPGSLEWFRWAAITRAPAESLAVRFVANPGPGGWDPAANYRPFREQIRRLQAS